MTPTSRRCALVLLLAAACADVRPGPDAAKAAGSALPAAAPPAIGAAAAVEPATHGNDGATAAHPAANGNGGSATDPALAEGLRLYRDQYCGTCHAFAAAGTAGIFGPPHDDMRTIAEQRIRDAKYKGEATTAEEYVRESVLRPGAYRVPGYERTRFLMPAYTNLGETQVDALIRLLLDPGNGGA